MPKPKIVAYTDAQHKKALARGRKVATSPYAIVDADYDPRGDRFHLTLKNGSELTVKRLALNIAPIRKATPAQLSEIEVSKLRDYVWFPQVNEGFSLGAVVSSSLGVLSHAEASRKGGTNSSPAKRRAAQENGRHGGRRKKVLVKA